MSTIQHIVLFQFKPDSSPEAIQEVYQQMLALKDTCISTTTSKPYIKSITGGLNITTENATAGMTHGFILEFNTPEDWDYYINQDPSHAEFKKLVAKILSKAIVFDFNPDSFETGK